MLVGGILLMIVVILSICSISYCYNKELSVYKSKLSEYKKTIKDLDELCIDLYGEQINKASEIKELKRHASNAAELRLKENKSRDGTIVYYRSLSNSLLTNLHKYQKAVYYIPELDQIVANEDLVRIGEL